jgi:UDP-glucuronate decarboxylase
MKRILLTGATGFIGSHVARAYAREDCEVYAFVRKGSDLWRIRDILGRVHIVSCDLLSAEEIDDCLDHIHPDLCLHMAWYAEPGKYLNSYENIRMLNASMHLASSLARTGCERLVVTGTCAEYDSSFAPLSEVSLTKPRSLYAASKLALFIMLEQMGRLANMQVAWVRLFYQFGPFEDERRLVPSVIRALLTGDTAKVTAGDQVRDFLHVEDVAEAIVAVAKSRLSGAVNVGSGDPTMVKDVVLSIAAMLNRPDLIALGARSTESSDPMFVCADNRKLTDGTGWIPKYDLQRGLHGTIEWWRKRLEQAHS